MKKWMVLVVFAFAAGALQAQARQPNWDSSYVSLDAGGGTSDILVDGLSFGFFLEPKLGLTPRIMIGSKAGAHFSTDENNIVAMETQVFLRWNFLRVNRGAYGSSGNPFLFFVQGGLGHLGAFRQFDGEFDNKNSRASFLADGTAGVTIPLGSHWHIEPSVRGGYPFMFGASVTVGRNFQLPRRTVREIVHELEYVEIIRELPPNEIIQRVLINQVEYIIFAGFQSHFNQGIDRDAQSLNELVIYHTSRILRENPDYRIRIEGHANPITVDPEERHVLAALSEARANEVARVLRESGVADEQIIVIAYGGTRVVASQDDVAHWNMNRRVELIIMQMDDN